MTETRHLIFDAAHVRHVRARAVSLCAPPAAQGDFLRREIADRLMDRLADINRPFPFRADMNGQMGPAFLETSLRTTGTRPATPGFTDISGPQGVTSRGSCDLSNPALGTADYDLIVSNLELHSVNDPVGHLIQMRRALKPDGLMMATLFGGETLFELRQSLLAGETATTGRVSPRVAPFGDIRDLGGLLGRAGLTLPVADLDRIKVTYENPLKLMQDLRTMGETNGLAERSRSFLRRDTLAAACAHYHKHFSLPDGRIEATFDIIYLTGWAPHESQQQPLKPGSATASLSEALKKPRAQKK